MMYVGQFFAGCHLNWIQHFDAPHYWLCIRVHRGLIPRYCVRWSHSSSASWCTLNTCWLTLKAYSIASIKCVKFLTANRSVLHLNTAERLLFYTGESAGIPFMRAPINQDLHLDELLSVQLCTEICFLHELDNFNDCTTVYPLHLHGTVHGWKGNRFKSYSRTSSLVYKSERLCGKYYLPEIQLLFSRKIIWLASQYSGDAFMADLQMPMMVVFYFSQLLYFHFYYGHRLTLNMIDLSDKIYQSMWYMYPRPVQRFMLHVMMQHAQRPVYISAYGLMTCSLNNFLSVNILFLKSEGKAHRFFSFQVTKTIYSAYMLLRSLA